MIFGRRKREKITQNIIDNLTLIRLEGDLYAVEAAIRDNEPVASSEEGGSVRKFINGIINDISNSVKRANTRELSVDREKARKALADFKSTHDAKGFEISNNHEKFRSYIDKNLFAKDKYGTNKASFALTFALDTRNFEYQCPEESLEVVSEIIFNDPKHLCRLLSSYRNNYYQIKKGHLNLFENEENTSGGSYGLLPKLGFVEKIKKYAENRRNLLTLSTLKETDYTTTFALYLTLIEHSSEVPEEQKKEMVNELIERVENVRSDAEYKWLAEGENAPESKKKIEVCNMTIERLSRILGI